MALVTKSFSDIITFTRASTATYFNSAGVLTSAAINEARFDFNPATLAARGLLIEEARTNSIRNNTMQGAVAGTPGTPPTNWALSGLAGLAQTIVGTGTESGIAYIDVRIFGTTTSVMFYGIAPEGLTSVAAAPNSIWTNSWYVKLVGGSTTGLSAIKLVMTNFNASGVALNQFLVTTIVPTSAALNTQRFTQTSLSTTFSDATTAFVRPILQFEAPTATAIDITVRIGLPQLELGAFATSVIPTTVAAATRNADQASVNTLSPWFNATAGTLYVEAQIAAGIGAAPAVMAGLDDTTINNRMQLRRQFPGNTGDYRFVSSGGNFTGSALSGALTSVNKQAGAYAASDQAGAVNSTLITGIVSVATLPTITRLALGDGQGSTPLNGWLRRVTYYPRRLSNAELQAITA